MNDESKRSRASAKDLSRATAPIRRELERVARTLGYRLTDITFKPLEEGKRSEARRRKATVMETERVCATCEYFDGGGEKKVQAAIKTGEPLHGDCLNRLSPRFQTMSNDTCPVWTEAT